MKLYVDSCDVCQKIKHKKHAPIGNLQPLPIPDRPFDVITMDFITELPQSEGYDAILVVVDKLTKYGLFLPVHTTDNTKETALIIFKKVVIHFGLPIQIVSDRDRSWTGVFWTEVCSKLGIQCLLSTAYHPQTDGQTEILNQLLEISLRAYVNEELNDWASKLSSFTLSYNTSVHSSTNYSPSYLLRGYHPRTVGSLLSLENGPINGLKEDIPRKLVTKNMNDPEAQEFLEDFLYHRNIAKESLSLAQAYQEKYYNDGRLTRIFEVGDLVLINIHSLNLLRTFEGKGRKLLPRFEGPFKVLERISPVAYRLRMPASYQGHPVYNIAHLEPYHEAEDKSIKRPHLRNIQQTFNELKEFEVEDIVDDKQIKGPKGRMVRQYHV